MEDNEDFYTNDEAHERLISAVTKLDKTQYVKDPTRSEPSNLNSEFNLSKSSNKVDINNVVKVLQNTASHAKIGKSLQKTNNASKVLTKPLEKPQAERLKRSTGYDEAKTKIGRWDAVVARSRTIDCHYFPLKRESNKMELITEFVSKFETKSSLQLALEEVDPTPAVVEEEEEPVYPATYEEMVIHRKLLAKLRAKESFKAAKAKHQSKIKSKKYHRILKKEKLKQQLKDFEELQKTNPEEALKKLEAIEKERALERHTLRHKNTGKWAKSKLVRAKYDKEVRQELAEQLSVSRNLTKKVQVEESSDDDDDDNVANNETIAEIELSQGNEWNIHSSSVSWNLTKKVQVEESSDDDDDNVANNETIAEVHNEWKMHSINKSNVDAESDYKKYLQVKADETKIVSKDGEESLAILDTKSLTGINITDNKISEVDKDILEHDQDSQVVETAPKETNTKHKSKRIVATSNWTVEVLDNKKLELNVTETADICNAFDSLETELSSMVAKKLQTIRNNLEKVKVREGKQINIKKIKKDSVEYLQFKTRNKKPIIDQPLIETTSKVPDKVKEQANSLESPTKQMPIENQGGVPANSIDVNKFLNSEPTFLKTAILNENQLDQLDDDDEQVVPKVFMEEALEEDDLVDSFRHEKEEEVNKDNPTDNVSSPLPGWGSWVGKGVKVPKRKRNRFIVKGAIKMPRRDENKGDIIIKEFKDPKVSIHKVGELPFPFTSVKEFEASMRAPLGNTFIPERAYRNVIRPNVITRAGTVIDPMDEDELLQKKNRLCKRKTAIQLLNKK